MLEECVCVTVISICDYTQKKSVFVMSCVVRVLQECLHSSSLTFVLTFNERCLVVLCFRH